MGLRIPGTELLLHFDGENGSRVFEDLSPNPKKIGQSGHPTVDTTQSLLGKPSVYLDGASYLFATEGRIGSNEDFTVEFFARRSDSGTNTTICLCFVGGSGYYWTFYWRGSTDSFAVYNSYNGTHLYGTVKQDRNQWYHYACTREGSTVRLFIDGVLVGTTTTSYTDFTDYILIGTSNGNDSFTGNIAQVRVVAGRALYSSSFTVPTEPVLATPDVFSEAKKEINNVYLIKKDEGSLFVGMPRYNLEQAATVKTDGRYLNMLPYGFPDSEKNKLFSIDARTSLGFNEPFFDKIGYGTIVGNVREKFNKKLAPCKCRVFLYRQPDNALVKTVWSDELGNYSFVGINPNYKYMVIARHPKDLFNAEVIDNITPNQIPQPIY